MHGSVNHQIFDLPSLTYCTGQTSRFIQGPLCYQKLIVQRETCCKPQQAEQKSMVIQFFLCLQIDPVFMLPYIFNGILQLLGGVIDVIILIVTLSLLSLGGMLIVMGKLDKYSCKKL